MVTKKTDNIFIFLLSLEEFVLVVLLLAHLESDNKPKSEYCMYGCKDNVNNSNVLLCDKSKELGVLRFRKWIALIVGFQAHEYEIAYQT